MAYNMGSISVLEEEDKQLEEAIEVAGEEKYNVEEEDEEWQPEKTKKDEEEDWQLQKIKEDVENEEEEKEDGQLEKMEEEEEENGRVEEAIYVCEEELEEALDAYMSASNSKIEEAAKHFEKAIDIFTCEAEGDVNLYAMDDEEENLHIAIAASVEDHADQLQLKETIAFSYALYASEQEALNASDAAGSSPRQISTSHEETREFRETQISTQVGIEPKCLSITETLPKRSRRAGKEVVEGMESRPLLDFELCGICLEAKVSNGFFHREGCSHMFCHNCIAQHVLCKLQERSVPVNCPNPNCSEYITPDQCENMFPGETLDKWRLVLEEFVFLDSHKYYCPFQDCGALLLKDDAPKITVNQSECPVCRRLFCVQCGVPWHVGFSCIEFRSLSPSQREQDDLEVLAMAKEKVSCMKKPC